MDRSSLFYVNHNDGPYLFVTPVLYGSNYHSFMDAFYALGDKMKFEFVDGTILVVTDYFGYSFCVWNRCNTLLHSWIMNFVSESIIRSIVFIENTSDVWPYIKEVIAQGDSIRISELMQEIYVSKQDSRYVTMFYYQLKILREELEIYMHIPSCSCRIRCYYDAVRSACQNHTFLYAICFLTSLNDNLSIVKSQILLLDQLPSTNKISSMVIQHERKNNLAHVDDSKVLINSVDTKKPNNKYF